MTTTNRKARALAALKLARVERDNAADELAAAKAVPATGSTFERYQRQQAVTEARRAFDAASAELRRAAETWYALGGSVEWDPRTGVTTYK